MNYEEEAKKLLVADFQAETLVDFRRDKAAAWLRQHDARLLRDMADLHKPDWDAYEEGRIDAWLERRASEIERGEKS